MDTSPCILWTPFHYECIMHTMDTSPYCGHLSIMNAICILWIHLHTVDTSPLWMQYAYYGHLSIMNAICILSTPLHTVDTSPLWTDTSAFFISHTMDTFSYKSLLHTPLHKLWTPLHTKETYAQCGPLRILQTPLHTAVYTYAYMYHGHLCII